MFIRAHTHAQEPRRRWLAGLLAFMVFGLGLLSVAPTLHLAIHHDADSAQHQCAVDLFAGGVTPVTAVVFFAPVALLALGSIAPVTRVALVAPTWTLPPGRGPPIQA